MEQFLAGGNDIDQIVVNSDITKNLPLLLALTGFFNTTICGYTSRAILPYC
jgi:glucose-6-phosphate isomerase